METLVEIEGVNGEWFTIAGLGEGDQGVWLGSDVNGIYDPPVKVVYEEPGNYPGARYLTHRVLRRDITFKVLILDDRATGGGSWMSRDSEWRKAWAFDKDTLIHITTEDSGHRFLKVRLGQSIDVSTKYDPNGLTLNEATMTLIAGDPFWYEEDTVFSALTRSDTRFQPTIFGPPWSFGALPQETLFIDVPDLNPTDQYIWLKWSVPGSTEQIPTLPWPFPPGTAIPWETAPFAQWVIPDYSFEDPTHADRRLKLPGLIIGENCVIDTDPRVEQVTSASGSQVWARMNGVRFRYPVPPYTGTKRFQIDVAGCAPGQMIQLRIPRPWSRPWGLE